MARLFTCGFERNSTTNDIEWTTNTGSPTISSSTYRTGAYAGRISSLSSGTPKYFGITFQVEAAGETYYRAYWRFATLPSAANAFMMVNDTSGAVTSPTAYLTIDNSGVVRLYDEDGQITGTTTLSTNTWYRIELHISNGGAGGSHTVEARVDGAACFATSSTRNVASNNSPQGFICGGNLLSESQTTGEWFIDDCAVNNTTGSFQNSWPGDGKIIALYPDSAGDNSDWTNDWSYVDEQSSDGASTYCASNTLNQIDDHNLQATPAAIGSADTINVVAVNIIYAPALVANCASFVARIKATSGGTVEESSAITPNDASYRLNANALPFTPILTLYDLPGASTSAWTKSTLDTMQLGYRISTGNTNAIRITSIMAMIDFTPASTYTPKNRALSGPFVGPFGGPF